MKALTFKKTAVAAALLATAGFANAASVVKFGTVSTAEAVTAAGTLTVASELTSVDSKKFTVAGSTALDGNAIAVTLPTTALTQNSLIKFTFTNGGLDSADGYKLVAGASDGDAEEVTSSIFSQTVKNGVITELTLRITAAAGINQADTVYLYNDTFANDTTNSSFNVTAASGLVLKAMKDAPHNAKVTVKVTADHVNNGVIDSIFDSNTLTLGTVLNGLKLNGFTKTVANVDFAADALKFVVGTNVTASTVTSSGLRVTANEYSLSNGKFSVATTGGTALTTPATPSDFEYDLSIKADNCNALKVTTSPASTGLALTPGTLVKSTTADCTWTAADVPAENALSLVATVDGKTALGENKFVATYDVNFDGSFDGSNKSQDDVYAGKTSTAIEWNTDVQANGTVNFPYLLAFNNNNAAFSFVKVDNTGNTKDLKLAMKGTLQTPLVEDSKQVKFENYYLMTVPAGQIGDFSGDDIIAALKKAKGKAEDGFNATDLDLDAANLFNMSVTLQAVSGGASMSAVKFSGVNTSSNGRTSVSVQ